MYDRNRSNSDNDGESGCIVVLILFICRLCGRSGSGMLVMKSAYVEVMVVVVAVVVVRWW